MKRGDQVINTESPISVPVGPETLGRIINVVGDSIDEKGGLSGKPLFLRSSRILEKARIISDGKISLIGLGGVETAEHAYAKILIGASLIQIYTSFVYKGPEVLQQILYDLLKFMHRDGFKSLSEAVGVLDFKEAMKINNIRL